MFYVCFGFDKADRKQNFFKFVRWKFDFFLSLFDGSSIGDEDTTKQYHFIGAKKMIIVTPHPPNPKSGSRRIRSITLPILLPARAFGSILYGLRLRLSVFGLLGSGEGSAGRAVRASHVPRKPTLPACDLRCATATLAVAPLSPSTYRLFACALRYTTLPEPLPTAICYAIDTAAIDGNHRLQSPSRRHCLCGSAA